MKTNRMVKYFKEGDLPYYEAGSFRFGSLESYRRAETHSNPAARFSDSREGISRTAISSLVFHRFSSINDSVFATEISPHVFCASLGDYDAEHHRKMRDGDENYPGNSELTNYCVIDIDRFGHALNKLWPGNANLASPAPTFDAANIVYGERDVFIQNGHMSSIEVLQDSELNRAIFVKPPYFSVEREIRFVFRQFSSPQVRLTKDAAYPQSALLREAIIKFGP